MKVLTLPALSDNYMYLIIDEKTKDAAVVDPVNPDSVVDTIKKEGCNLTKILTTHHHWDHAGGNKALMEKYKNKLEVYGGDKRIDSITNTVKHGDKIEIGKLNVKCLLTPCHTTGHVCYYVDNSKDAPAVFTGDTLFIGGCGRFFEGTAQEMYIALNDILGKLPGNTNVYCGHEYTEKNLEFARFVEKDNPDILRKIQMVKEKRRSGLPTVPSTINEEKLTNPFMRVNEITVKKHAGTKEPVETMRVIREQKNTFK